VGQQNGNRGSSDSEGEQQLAAAEVATAEGGESGDGAEGWLVGEAEDQMPESAPVTRTSNSIGRSFSLGAKQPKDQKEELRDRLIARSEVSARSHVQLEQLRKEYTLQRGSSMGSKVTGSYTSLTSLEGWLPDVEGSVEVSMEDILSVLRHVGQLRGAGQLLLPHERLAYAKV
jgi:hypothetical protein